MRPNALLTWIASTIWSIASSIARELAQRGFIKQVRLPVRVISVGNLQAGGAGKTPLVALIARQAHERGLVACILCRGYGGEWETRGGTVEPVDVGAAYSLDPGLCGDEAMLLHELVPHAWIGIGSDRARAFEKVSKQAKRIDLVILDDGFQHHRLARDIDVVALTSAKPHERLFRDWFSQLKHADLAVWTKGEQLPDEARQALRSPIARVSFGLPKASGQEPKLRLVTGLGDGASVRKALVQAGYRISGHLEFPDHARYDRSMVEELVSGAKVRGERIALTGKDWVKWRTLGVREVDVFVFEPELEFLEGAEAWEHLLWSSK